MACYGGLEGILTGLTKSTDHPSSCSRSLRGRLTLRTQRYWAYVPTSNWENLHKASYRRVYVGLHTELEVTTKFHGPPSRSPGQPHCIGTARKRCCCLSLAYVRSPKSDLAYK